MEEEDDFWVSSIELYPKASRRRRALRTIVVVLVIGLLVYLGLLYYSMTNVEVSVDRVGFSSPNQLLNIVASRRLSVDVYLNVKGKGVLPVDVKSFSSDIYLEGQYVGFVKSSQPFTIEPGESRPVHLVLTLDASSISAESLASVVQSVMDHNGEVMVALDGKVEVSALFFSLDVPVRRETYVLIAPPSPRVEQAVWSKTSCKAGESVDFQVVVSNVYRSQRLTGTLEVAVREDVALSQDRDASVYTYQLDLAPGEKKTLKGTFKTYAGTGTRGFFLKVFWDGRVISEQPPLYPPRLQVIVPRAVLRVIDAYWTVGGQRVSSCKVGDVVTAHIILHAEGSSVEGPLTIRVRKDLAFMPDKDLQVENQYISIGEGQNREITVTFRPDEPSSSSLRGYFVELEGIVSWTMPENYPPRLQVYAASPVQGTLVVESAWWTVNGRVVTSAIVGQVVTAHVRVRAVGGNVQEVVQVRVRRDLALQPDTDLVVNSFNVKLENGQSMELTVTFTASEKSGLSFRGYFLEVDFLNSQRTWTMENSYPPRLKVEG